jgi:hypothetical protein
MEVIDKTAKGLIDRGIIMLFLSLSVVGQATAQTWNQLTPTDGPPPARGFHGMSTVYDPSTNRMIVFGGRLSNNNNSNDVWVLTKANGAGGTGQWINLIADGAPGSPPSRSGHSAVYDATSNRMTIFGGCNGFCLPTLNDVWVLTNANGLGGTAAWIQLSTAGVPPSGRTRHTAVYDPTTNRMIVFAGQNGGGFGCSTFGDVWVLSNANGLGGTPTWTQLSPTGGPPPGQYAPSAVYEPASNRMTVFGGSGFVSATCQNSNAVWVLENANGVGGTPSWINLIAEGAAGSPVGRGFHSAVYDAASNRMTIFGGGDGIQNLNDTWFLVNANGLGGSPSWNLLMPTGGPPAARSSHGAVFDAATKRMTIFGGNDATDFLNDTWVLTNANGNLNQPPVAVCQNMTVVAGPDCTAAASIDNGSFDPDAGDTITLTQSPPGPYPLGNTTVTLTVTDSHGAMSSCTAIVTVVDETPPSITNVSATPSVLWPPNHRMVDVTVKYDATDNCGPVTCALSVSSNEPIDGLGDGDTAPDWEVVDAHHVRLRAERSGTANGRVYSITITCSDGTGNTTVKRVTVSVPHDQRN